MSTQSIRLIRNLTIMIIAVVATAAVISGPTANLVSAL